MSSLFNRFDTKCFFIIALFLTSSLLHSSETLSRDIKEYKVPKDSKFIVIYYSETDHSMNLGNGDIHPNFLRDKKKWMHTILTL